VGFAHSPAIIVISAVRYRKIKRFKPRGQE
jgi:hypothetical protein